LLIFGHDFLNPKPKQVIPSIKRLGF